MVDLFRLFSLISFIACVLTSAETSTVDEQDVYRDMISLVSAAGYQLEEHFVQTEDGYILGLFRLRKPGSLRSSQSNESRVALLMHGLLDSSIVYVNNGVERSLGFLLVEQGYDVWLGNNRGNTWSKRHAHMKSDDKDFWDFSFDEMADFDIPAMVDYVLKVTGEGSLTYVGHSQGSTQMVAALSTEIGRKRLGSKIKKFIGLAPAIFESHMSSLLLKALAKLNMDQATELLGVHEFVPTNKIFETLLPGMCKSSPHLVCENAFDLVYGHSTHLNIPREKVFVANFPAGTSARNIVHWGQHTRHNRFGRFDHGAVRNLIKYGTAVAPDYDLASFPKDMDVTLYFGTNDALQVKADRDRLRKELPDSVQFMVIDEYSHVDFVWGKDPERRVFPDLFGRMADFKVEDHLTKVKKFFLRATSSIQ